MSHGLVVTGDIDGAPGKERAATSAATPADVTAAAGEPVHRHLRMLDGWRAVSIGCVMAAHMLPLGPAWWNLNGQVAALGMAVFFTLSGFLIVSILSRDDDIGRFLVRRILRIVPVAWTALALSLPWQGVAPAVWIGNFTFTANLPPFPLAPWSGHFWSLCVEMQFYAGIALALLLLGRRGLWLVPAVAAVVTTARVAVGAEISIVTWLRVDEILAGGTLALIVHGDPTERWRRGLARLPFWPMAGLAALSAAPSVPVLDYLRPYLIAISVGITVLRPIVGLSPLLESRPAAYVARISYALYIVHPFTMLGWLGSGVGWAKYAKRPLCVAISFAVAHLSTFHFERHFIAWSHRFRPRPSAVPPRATRAA